MRINAAQTIKERLTMRDVLERYGYAAKRRMPCMLHGGKDNNFEVKEHSWRCYSHCGSGDVISFVQKLFGLSFADALKKIDSDFGLCLFDKPTLRQYREMQHAEKKRMAEKIRAEKERALLEKEHNDAIETLCLLKETAKRYAPTTLSEEWNPLFVDALHKISYQEHILDTIEERRFALK
jgi:DNA primase